MSKTTFVIAVVAGVMAGGAYVLPAAAQAPPPPIAAEPLTARSVVVDDIGLKFKIKLDGEATHVIDVKDPSWTVVVRYTVQPGAQFPWHSHAGPVVVNLVSGALTYVGAEDCVPRTYATGQAFVDPGQGHVHTAFRGRCSDVTFVPMTASPEPTRSPSSVTACGKVDLAATRRFWAQP